MAKKAQGVVGTFLSAIGGGILGRIRDAVSNVSETVQEKVYQTLRRLVQELYIVSFTVIAVVFILLGIAFFLREKLVPSMGASFLIVGLGVLVAVLLYRSTIEKRR